MSASPYHRIVQDMFTNGVAHGDHKKSTSLFKWNNPSVKAGIRRKYSPGLSERARINLRGSVKIHKPSWPSVASPVSRPSLMPHSASQVHIMRQHHPIGGTTTSVHKSRFFH